MLRRRDAEAGINLRHHAGNDVELQNIVLRRPDDLGELRQRYERRQGRLRNRSPSPPFSSHS